MSEKSLQEIGTYMLSLESEGIRYDFQKTIEQSDFYAARVTKEKWPTQIELSKNKIEFFPREVRKDMTDEDFGIAIHHIKFKKAAINSPAICVIDYLAADEFGRKELIRNTTCVVTESLKWVWSQSFQNDFIRICANHSVCRHNERYTASFPWNKNDVPAAPQHSRRINFFGRVVNPYTLGKHGAKSFVNPKYKKAAEQLVIFNPETVTFQFNEPDIWAGSVMFHNIPDAEHNPDGNIGFFRVIMGCAAKPNRPDLGSVTTVIPPGIKGFFWYWAWRLVGYVP